MTIRWGILGAGRISHRFATSLEQVEGAELTAIAGRTAEKLAAFAEEHPVAEERRYASPSDNGKAAYQRLIDDPAIDAIYLSLPHGLHATWAERALEAGKAVLCEKPAFVCEGEARAIRATSERTGTLFMEAMKNRFCPLHDCVMGLVGTGELGAVRSIETVQTLDYGPAPTPYLLDARQGGALLDMGCYAVSWVEELTQGSDIHVLSSKTRWRAAAQEGERVDWADDIRLSIGGVDVHFVLDGEADYQSTLTITCEKGTVAVDRLHRPEHAEVRYADGRHETIDAPAPVDDFFGEVNHFCSLVRAGKAESPKMPTASTQRIAHIMDAMQESRL